MGAFELQTKTRPAPGIIEESCAGQIPRRIIDECIIAYKVYDSCRRQNCLTYRELGPPICVDPPEGGTAEGTGLPKPEIPVIVPVGAATVTIDQLRVAKIVIGPKKPNPFRAGYWDVDVKYDFEYTLYFSNASGEIIEEVYAKSSFKTKTTLFGSIDGEATPEKNHTYFILQACRNYPVFYSYNYLIKIIWGQYNGKHRNLLTGLDRRPGKGGFFHPGTGREIKKLRGG